MTTATFSYERLEPSENQFDNTILSMAPHLHTSTATAVVGYIKDQITGYLTISQTFTGGHTRVETHYTSQEMREVAARLLSMADYIDANPAKV